MATTSKSKPARASKPKRAPKPGTVKPTPKASTIKSKVAQPARKPLELADCRKRAVAASAAIPAAVRALNELARVLRACGDDQGDGLHLPADLDSFAPATQAALAAVDAILRHFDRDDAGWLSPEESRAVRAVAPELFDAAMLARRAIARVPYPFDQANTGKGNKGMVTRMIHPFRADLPDHIERRAKALQALAPTSPKRTPADPWGDTSGLETETIDAIKWLYTNRDKEQRALFASDLCSEIGIDTRRGPNLSRNLRNAANHKRRSIHINAGKGRPWRWVGPK